jgi:hypothetical protein
MKTFEQERKALYDWLLLRNEEYMEASRRAPLVLDGDYACAAKFREALQEYNTRLRELKP